MQFFNLSTGVLLLSAVLSTTALPTLTPNAIALQARDEVSEAKIIPRGAPAAEAIVQGVARIEEALGPQAAKKAEKDYQARLASGAVKNPAEKATKPTIHRRMWGALKNVWRVDRVRGFAMRWERYEAKKEKEARIKSAAAQSAAAQAAKITRRTPMSAAAAKGLEEGIAAASKKEAERLALKAEQRAQAQRDREEAEAEDAALAKWSAEMTLRYAHEAKMIQRHGSREKWQQHEAEMKTFREARKKAGLDALDIRIIARPPTNQRRTPMWGGAVMGWKESIAAAKKKKADQDALKSEERTAENAVLRESAAKAGLMEPARRVHSPATIQRRTPMLETIINAWKKGIDAAWEKEAAREAARRQKLFDESYQEQMALRKVEAEAREKAQAERMAEAERFAAKAERKSAKKKAQEEAEDADWAERMAKHEADMIAKHGSKEAWEAQKIKDRKELNRKIAAEFAAKNRQREWAHNYIAEMDHPPDFRIQAKKDAYLDQIYKLHHPEPPKPFYGKGLPPGQHPKDPIEAWKERHTIVEKPFR